MRVLICGSRSWTDGKAIKEALGSLLGVKLVIEGGARGADTLGRMQAESRGLPVMEFPANWTYYGKGAGPIRNQSMLVFGQPDIVLAFWDGTSRGTADMIRQAETAGIPVKVIKPTAA